MYNYLYESHYGGYILYQRLGAMLLRDVLIQGDDAHIFRKNLSQAYGLRDPYQARKAVQDIIQDYF